jgi:DnaJ-domain-containing protein 1
MQLPGRLSATTLGDLLGVLHRQRTTGQLELCDAAGRHHRIELWAGLVHAVETPLPTRPLGELLVDAGFVGPGSIHLMLQRIAAGDRRPAGEILIAHGAVQAEVVTAALRAQLRDRLDALFEMPDARVAFHPPRPSPAAARRSGPLGPSDFLYGRPRRRDSGRSARRPTPRPFASGVGAASRAVPPVIVDDARARALAQLGVGADADVTQIRRAFRRLAAELHPDRFTAAPAEERQRRAALFARLSAAYHQLV